MCSIVRIDLSPLHIHVSTYTTLKCPSYNVTVLNFKLGKVRYQPLFDGTCEHRHRLGHITAVHLPFHHSNIEYDINYVFPSLCNLMYFVYVFSIYYNYVT